MSTAVTIPKHPSLLEISTRPWLYSLGQKYGKTDMKLKDVPDSELETIKSQGYNIVWLMGIWKLGDAGLQHDKTDSGLRSAYDTNLPGWTEDDVIGSPYAIVDYVPNPQIGSLDDVKAFAEKIHKLGIAFFVDLVPNHSAVDNPLVTEHIEYYVRAPQGTSDPSQYLSNGVAYGKDPYSGAWTDTAQYNIFEPAMRTQLLNYLLKCAEVADGVRCDMAMLELNSVFATTWGTQLAAWGYNTPSTEFWKDVIANIKSRYPNFLFMAEVYWGKEREMIANGFDYIYDKDGLYNRLVDGNLDSIRSWITSQDLTPLTHFTENHDEKRAIAEFSSVARANAAAVVSMTLPGMKFYFDGQREGKAARLDVHLRRSTTESVKSDVVAFYDRLQASLNASVWHEGDFTYIWPNDVDGSSWRLVCWKWKKGTEKRLVVVNYSDASAYARIVLSDAGEKATSDSVTLVDELNSVSYKRSASELASIGLFVALDPWAAHIFNY